MFNQPISVLRGFVAFLKHFVTCLQLLVAKTEGIHWKGSNDCEGVKTGPVLDTWTSESALAPLPESLGGLLVAFHTRVVNSLGW